MNGIEVANGFRESGYHGIIVFLTALENMYSEDMKSELLNINA